MSTVSREPVISAPVAPAPEPKSPDAIGNRNFWTNYDWPRAQGEEWSEAWGGTEGLWFGTLYPRLRAFLPVANVLEIGPGSGRVTQYLRLWCEKMTVIDVTERCRERFADSAHIAYVVNDGRSLSMIADSSVDLAVSWESLVHAEHETVREYLRQLALKLKPGGAAFIHHSNLGEHEGSLPKDLTSPAFAGRRASMSAAKFRADCAEFGLACQGQEIMSACDNAFWTDCLSLVVRDPGRDKNTRTEYRHDWAIEKANARRVAEIYRRSPETF